jgi:drug/metabolite transporter (DMT)-like permease
VATPTTQSFFSYVLLFLPPFFWSTNFIVGKALVGSVPPWTLNTGRFVVSALFLVPFLIYSGAWRTVPKSALPALVLMSLVGVSAFNSLLYAGLRHTSAINGSLVNAAMPITTACIAWFLIGEKMTRRRLFGIVLSFGGVAWIVGGGDWDSVLSLRVNPGDLLVFFATTLWGFYSVMAKKLMQTVSPFVLTAVTTGIGVVFLIPAALIELSFEAADLGRPDVLWSFVYLGIFPSLVAFLLWNRSILVFGPTKAALVYNTIPLFAVVLSVLILGETPRFFQLAGGMAIVLGVVIGTMESRPKARRTV